MAFPPHQALPGAILPILLGSNSLNEPTFRERVRIIDDSFHEGTSETGYSEAFSLRIALGFGPDQTDIVSPTSAPDWVKALNVTVGTAEAEVLIFDNDEVESVTLRSPGGLIGGEVREGSENQRFAVWLVYPEPTEVTSTVDYEVREATVAEAGGRARATAGSDFVAKTGRLTFRPGETYKTVSLDVPRTPELDPDEVFAVELSNPSGVLRIEESLAIYSIHDNPGPYRSRMGVGSGAPAETEGGGCAVELWVEFRDGNGDRTQVHSLAATDFTVENGRVGTPVAAANGLRWTVPAWSTAGFTGLMRVRLAAKEPDDEEYVQTWEAAEQLLRVRSDTECEAASGVLEGFVLVDASSDADLGAVTDGATVSAEGSYGIRAEVEADAEVGSVVLSLGGPGESDVHERTEAVAPYSLFGDTQGAEHGRALAPGSYTLSATAYAESGGAGDVLGTLTVPFTVAVEAPPAAPPPPLALTGFVLLDASDQSTVAALADGARVDLGGRSGGSFGIRADVASDATVGSVVLSLSGAKTVSRTESLAPYSLYGDDMQGTLHGGTLPAGTYTLSATAYAERGAAGTVQGTLSVSFTVLAPAALSVADAEAEEGTDATLDFQVTLDREAAGTVTVEYATSDGTALAGSDYTATSGTLTFAPGETEKTVSVPVLEDDHDEGSETLTLRLTSASGATIADGEATGTITNSDPIPQAWLARFGRTVTGQVLEAVEARLTGSRQAGSELSLAGQALPSWPAGDAAGADHGSGAGAGDARAAAAAERKEEEARAGLASMTAWLAQADPDGHGTEPGGVPGEATGREPESRALTGRDFITGTSFALTGGSSAGGFASLWGRGSIAGFDGSEGDLTLDGEVTTGLIGADWSAGPKAGPGRWTAGLALGHSTGTGAWRRGGDCAPNCAGAIEATLSGLYPYAGLDLTELST